MPPNIFNLLTNGELRGIPWIYKNMDDLLIIANSFPELCERVIYLLRVCIKKNIKLSHKKVQIGKQVVFGGVQLSYNPTLESVDMAPEEAKIEAIRSMSVPTNKKSAESLLGCCFSSMKASFSNDTFDFQQFVLRNPLIELSPVYFDSFLGKRKA